MVDSEADREARAKLLRDAIEERQQPPGGEPEAARQPGESDLHYVERRMREKWELERRKNASQGESPSDQNGQ
jgi:hypothetical protein